MESTNHWQEQLSDYLDGELDEQDRAACEAHLAGCPHCAEAAQGLRAVVAQASLLPQVPPSRDLWPGIEGRLDPRARSESPDAAPATVGPTGRPGPTRRLASRVWGSHWTLSVPQLAAAAIALVVLTAGAMWTLAPGVGSDTMARSGGVYQTDPPVQPLLVAYAPAIAELEGEYEARRAQLDPETRRVVEENLAIIDHAIAEAERALAEDPSNPFVTTHLAGAMRQKVDLLRRVASIPTKES